MGNSAAWLTVEDVIAIHDDQIGRLAIFPNNAHIAAMATNPDSATTRSRRASNIAGRSALTGGFVLKPVSKGATITLAQVRAAVKKLDARK